METPHPLTLPSSTLKSCLFRQPNGRPDRQDHLLFFPPLHRHSRKDGRSVLTARPDSAPGQPQSPCEPCSAEMTCGFPMRLSGFYIVRAVLPMLPLSGHGRAFL